MSSVFIQRIKCLFGLHVLSFFGKTDSRSSDRILQCGPCLEYQTKKQIISYYKMVSSNLNNRTDHFEYSSWMSGITKEQLKHDWENRFIFKPFPKWKSKHDIIDILAGS
jgi:hypothetical protein